MSRGISENDHVIADTEFAFRRLIDLVLREEGLGNGWGGQRAATASAGRVSLELLRAERVDLPCVTPATTTLLG